MIYTKYGEVWMRTSMPRDLKKAVESRFHLLNNQHPYIFLVIGIGTNGKRYIVEATTYERKRDYEPAIYSLPMTVEHHSHKVYGKLAARHGRWEVEELNWRHRGVLNPNKDHWEKIFEGTYHQCKCRLNSLSRRNKRNKITFQMCYRLKIVGTLRADGEGVYRVRMGEQGDYFLCNVPFYGRNYISSQPENKKKRKAMNRNYYANKMKSQKDATPRNM